MLQLKCKPSRSPYLIRTVRMNEWFKISLLLSIFGFLKEIRPSEPFVYEFLVGPWRNVSKEQITEEVYPVGTYSYLAQSVVVFLITDLCRYKPLIVVLGVSGVVVWSMLLWTKGLVELQILEVRVLKGCTWLRVVRLSSVRIDRRAPTLNWV